MSVRPIARSRSRLRATCLLAFSLVSTSIGCTASAQAPTVGQGEVENQLAVWAGYGDSNNIGRISETPVAGTYRSLGLFLGLERQTSHLDAGISSNIEYRSYADDLFDEETVGTLEARALVDMVEDRFSWNFQGSVDQGQGDPFAARGPNNRETIKYVTTGPQLDIPFGRTSLLVGAGRRASRYEESTQVDNDTDDYRLMLARQVRPTALFALGASSGETEFLDGVAPNYRIEQLFLRLNKTLSRGSLNADLGTNEIGSNTQSRRDPLLDFAWRRSFGARSSFDVTAMQGFTGGDTDSGGTALVTSDPFERKSLGIRYDHRGERTTVTIGLGAGEEDYAGGVTLDHEYRSSNLTIDHRISPRLNIGLSYFEFDRDYVDSEAPSSEMEDWTAGIWLNRTIGRRFSIALDVSRYRQLSNEPVQETRTELRFAYSPTGSTSDALGSVGR